MENTIHNGGLILNIRTGSGEAYALEGSYWTDRTPTQTKGTLRFSERSFRNHEDFKEATLDTYKAFRPKDKKSWEFWKPGIE